MTAPVDSHGSLLTAPSGSSMQEIKLPDVAAGNPQVTSSPPVAIPGQPGSPTGPDRAGPVEVPSLLDRRQVEEHQTQFLQEYGPVGPTELAIVSDLARQRAAMDRWGDAAEAVERQAARHLPEFVLSIGNDPDVFRDTVLAGAMAAEATDRCERHHLGHARAFYRALQKLEETQARRKKREQAGATLPPSFTNELACEVYLAERWRNGQCHCPRCGATRGYFFPARRSWECGMCKGQAGLRSGTVMARSPISLWRWFEAIRWLLWQPTISTGELAPKLGIRRLPTVRTLASKVHKAMAAENASAQLAGLDTYFAQCRLST
jgi:transposase-like protein